MNTRTKAGRTSLARARKVLTANELFFFENAGFSYKPDVETVQAGKLRCARDLAKAERVAEQLGWSYEWKEDIAANASGEYPEATEVLGCILYDPLQRKTDRWHQLESLWGIDDPDRNYKRVIEAELASEALAHLNTMRVSAFAEPL